MLCHDCLCCCSCNQLPLRDELGKRLAQVAARFAPLTPIMGSSWKCSPLWFEVIGNVNEQLDRKVSFIGHLLDCLMKNGLPNDNVDCLRQCVVLMALVLIECVGCAWQWAPDVCSCGVA